MSLQIENIPARFSRGVAFLDAMFPGWHKKIDLDTFDFNVQEYCAVGQTTGNYDAFIEYWLIDDVEYGYNSYNYYGEEYLKVMNDKWYNLIRDRQQQGV